MSDLIGGTLPAPYDPVPVDDVTLAFPAEVRHLMPAWADTPEEHRAGRSRWADLQNRWFSRGLPEDTLISLKDDIDGDLAFRHLKAIQGTFGCKHEEKVAAVAFLMDTWFHGAILTDESGEAVEYE